VWRTSDVRRRGGVEVGHKRDGQHNHHSDADLHNNESRAEEGVAAGGPFLVAVLSSGRHAPCLRLQPSVFRLKSCPSCMRSLRVIPRPGNVVLQH
jgi:hypothetical protein